MNRRNLTYSVKVFSAVMLCMIMIMAAASAGYAAGLEIQWDFSNGTWEKEPPFVVTKGSFIIFRIININLKKYNVTIDGRLMNYNTTTPALFADKQADPTAVAGAVTPDKEDKMEIAASGEPEAETAAEALKQLKSIREHLHDIPGKLQDIRERMSKIKKFPVQLEIALYSAETFKQLEFDKNQLFKAFMGLEEDDPEAVETDVLVTELKVRLDRLKEKYKSIKNESAGLAGDIKGIVTKIENFIENKSKELTALDKTDPQKAKTLKEQIEEEKSLLKEERTLIETEEALIKKEESLTGKIMEEFNVDKYIKVLEELLGEFKLENFSISRTFSGLDADEVEIKVDITPLNPKNPVRHGLGTPVKVKVKGGWKMDFSTGVMFHINAHDRAYRLDVSPNDSNKVVIKDNTHKHAITPVMGALLHVYYRTAKSPTPTFTFGLGTGLAESLSYYAGGGFIFGFKRRFIISGGLALVKYARLLPEYKEKYENETELPKSSDLTPDKLVDPDYKLRWFVSFTYNF